MLSLIIISIVTIFILLLPNIDEVYAQEQTDSSTTTTDNNIQLLKYINSRDGYEIRYPAGVDIVLDISGLTVTDKKENGNLKLILGFLLVMKAWNNM